MEILKKVLSQIGNSPAIIMPTKWRRERDFKDTEIKDPVSMIYSDNIALVILTKHMTEPEVEKTCREFLLWLFDYSGTAKSGAR